MTFQLTTRRVLFAAAALLTALLYLAALTSMGVVSKDEPRYADIGRAMASSGDWITPRLWGQPWFEKPALLYWMIASGFSLHLGNDLAPRLPVALLSLAFLIFFFRRVRELWDVRIAFYSAALLATTAGWLAYSHVAVTDLPLAAFFTLAVLYAILPHTSRNLALAAGSLAFATLAKSLVPLVLFIPVVALDYRRWRDWLRPAPVAAFFVIALPWYLACTLRNGATFLRVLFIQQQFGRFVSPELQHVRPFWYYLPILLLLLYPWFPLLAILPRDWGDRRILTLTCTVAFGFVFFSASVNKLPGYLIPLLPLICILMGVGLARAAHPERVLALSVLLLGILPQAARVVPQALAQGLRSVPIPLTDVARWLPVAGLGAVFLLTVLRSRAVPVSVSAAALAFLWFQFAAFPAIDSAASARPLWISQHPPCVNARDRGTLYGLYYYSGHIIPPCADR